MAKSYKISKKMVYQAYKKVKANQATTGVDEETMEKFDGKMSGWQDRRRKKMT